MELRKQGTQELGTEDVWLHGAQGSEDAWRLNGTRGSEEMGKTGETHGGGRRQCVVAGRTGNELENAGNACSLGERGTSGRTQAMCARWESGEREGERKQCVLAGRVGNEWENAGNTYVLGERGMNRRTQAICACWESGEQMGECRQYVRAGRTGDELETQAIRACWESARPTSGQDFSGISHGIHVLSRGNFPGLRRVPTSCQRRNRLSI